MGLAACWAEASLGDAAGLMLKGLSDSNVECCSISNNISWDNLRIYRELLSNAIIRVHKNTAEGRDGRHVWMTPRVHTCQAVVNPFGEENTNERTPRVLTTTATQRTDQKDEPRRDVQARELGNSEPENQYERADVPQNRADEWYNTEAASTYSDGYGRRGTATGVQWKMIRSRCNK